MLEALKAEYDNMASEVGAYKSYKEEYEQKSESTSARLEHPFYSFYQVTSQIQEMQSVRQNVFDLQMALDKTKAM